MGSFICHKTKPVPDSSLYFNLAVTVWLIALLVVCIMVFLAPSERSVTPVYHTAVENWLAGDSLFTDGHLHYFPQFVFIFMPFHFMKVPYGDILWRILSVFLLVGGLWRMVTLVRQPMGENLFFLYTTLVALGPSLGAIRNGQANVIFAAITIHAAVCLVRSQWWPASLLLLGAIVVKPIGLVMLFLSVLVYRAIIWWVALGIVIYIAIPFLFAGESYVFSQYRQSLEHLFAVSVTTEHRFADINGLLRTLGIGLAGSTSQIIRLGAGVLTALLWLIGSQQIRGLVRACFLLGMTTTYLMLFNPMTEGNSYVIVAPSIALYAASFFSIQKLRPLGWGLAFMSFSIYPLPEIVHRLDEHFGLWWCPAMMLIFFALLVSTVFASRFRKLNSL